MKDLYNSISFVLAEKLKEKGMPIRIKSQTFAIDGKCFYDPAITYEEVLDWLTKMGIRCSISPRLGDWGASYAVYNISGGPAIYRGHSLMSWLDAANVAIREALTLIHQENNENKAMDNKQ